MIRSAQTLVLQSLPLFPEDAAAAVAKCIEGLRVTLKGLMTLYLVPYLGR